ncbi:inversin-A-like isoform X1 [Rhopilema esculentum]|uniref:inversin-A-like isoform X1 n=1 Tax=Rhopilema esculentum TaxID=499914 RepID=UPI0031E0A9BB
MANGPVNPKLHKDLLLACGWGKEIDVVLLLQQGASVKVQDQNGRNCLHYAASKGHTNIVEILLLKKCNANAKDKYGSTPLHQAAVNGHTECVATLIEGGADVNFQDENGNTPLYEAVWNNQVDTVDLFLKSEADVNIRNKEGYTPLHLSCQNDYGKVIQNLVKWGASLQSPTSTGNTPLHIAIQNSHIDAVKTLLALEADINIQNHDGDTPLHLCAEHGDKKIAKLLLESGQPFEPSLNNVGDSPKDIAVQLGNKEVADLIPTPMISRKQTKKSEIPGSPKRPPKQRVSSAKAKQAVSKETGNSDSLERPVQVVVQPPSVDNLAATDTCSSLSSLWLPVPDSGGHLPMDVYWQKNMSPSPERRGKNFENITDLNALKEIKKSDHHSQSDGSTGGVRSPRYQIRKKRRKYTTGHASSKHKGKDDFEDDNYKNEKESRTIKDPKTSKLFKKKKQASAKMVSSKKLKRVLEQGEDEISLTSPKSFEKSETADTIPSPRVKGRAEIRMAAVTQLKETPKGNGAIQLDQLSLEEQIQYKKGLREFLKDSLASRKSPANTDEGSSSKTGTLEHKKGKDSRLGHAELKEHMKLTEKDIDALLKKEILGTGKESKNPTKRSKDPKKSQKKSKKAVYGSEDDDDEDIVVIRLDPKLEMPKKSKRSKERRTLENGVRTKEDDSFFRDEKDRHTESRTSKGDTLERKHDRSSSKKETPEKKLDKSKREESKGTLKREKKQENKEWPKFEVLMDETCGKEAGPSGATSPKLRPAHHETDKGHRTHRRSRSPDFPSKEATFEKIHKLEKRFKHFLQLTTEKLDEQKEIDSKHYSELKNDISSMERNLERTTRNSALEMIETVTKELDCSMKKWTKALRSIKREGKSSEWTSDASSDLGRISQNRKYVVTSAIVTRSPRDSEADKSSTLERRKGLSNTNKKANGHVIMETAEEETPATEQSLSECAKEEKSVVSKDGDAESSFAGHKEGRAAPQGRSDESSPSLLSRHPGDGDHMSLEKWYQEQLKEAEERWRLKAESDQQALRNRIKELEDVLFQFTGTHNTMV